MNILEINKKEKLQLKTENDLKYNKHISDKNNTIDTNSRETYSINSISYSKNDLVKKNKKRGEKQLYSGEEDSNNSSSSKKSITKVFTIKKKNNKYMHRYDSYSGHDNTNKTNTIPTDSK